MIMGPKKYSEAHLQQALQELKDTGKSMRSIGKKYNIPEATLRHRVSGYHTKATPGPKTLFTKEKEKVITNYINISAKRGMPVTKLNVMSALTNIPRTETNTSFVCDVPPGFKEVSKQKYWRFFKKRHPEITFRTPESLSKSRKNVSVQVVKQWFHDAMSYFAENNLAHLLGDPSRNFNIDETGFSMSPMEGRVFASNGEKKFFQVVSNQQKVNITVESIICADGRIPPPMIIYPRKRIGLPIAESMPHNYKCVIGKSEKGYITVETLYYYLCNGFDFWLTENNVERPVILWTDWHETRNNYHLAKKLNELQIILYALPPNTTHFMQPLDVSVFGFLKKKWPEAVRDWETATEKILTQQTFAEVLLPLYYSVREQDIQSGFRRTGLVPFDPEAPDYTKLTLAAVKRESDTILFEGIIQGDSREISVQTDTNISYNKATQVDLKTRETTKSMQPMHSGSMCDMFIETKALVPQRSFLEDSTMTLSEIKKKLKGEDQPKCHLLLPKPVPSRLKSTPTASKDESKSSDRPTPKISPFFKEFCFFPKPHINQGPKFKNLELLIRKRKKKEEEAKKKPRKKTDETISIHDTSSDEDDLNFSEFGMILDEDDPLDVDDWVGVKVPRMKEKAGKCFEVYIAKIKSVDSYPRLFTISFYKEKSENFFISTEETSYPVISKELVKLEHPNRISKNREWGFQFRKRLKRALTLYFDKQEA